MLGGLCLASLIPFVAYELVLYPSGDCKYLSVDPDAVKTLELPGETEVAMCTVID